MFEKFLAWLKSAGLVTDANEADVTKKLKDANLIQDTPVPPVKDGTVSTELLNELQAMRKELKEAKDALAEEKKQRDLGIKSQQDQLAAANKKKIDEFVAKALTDGKINEAGKEQLVKDAEANFDLAQKWVADKAVIAGFKPAKDVKKTEDGGGKQQNGQPATSGDVVLDKVLQFANVS